MKTKTDKIIERTAENIRNIPSNDRHHSGVKWKNITETDKDFFRNIAAWHLEKVAEAKSEEAVRITLAQANYQTEKTLAMTKKSSLSKAKTSTL